jgi:hypothetical protein
LTGSCRHGTEAAWAASGNVGVWMVIDIVLVVLLPERRIDQTSDARKGSPQKIIVAPAERREIPREMTLAIIAASQ